MPEPTTELIAAKPFRYGDRGLAFGDHFTATVTHAKLLTVTGFARYAKGDAPRRRGRPRKASA